MLREGKNKSVSEIGGNGMGLLFEKVRQVSGKGKTRQVKYSISPIGFVGIDEGKNIAYVATDNEELPFKLEEFSHIEYFASAGVGMSEVDYVLKDPKTGITTQKRMKLKSMLLDGPKFEEFLDK